MDFLANIPSLVLSCYFPQMASLSFNFFYVLSKEKNFFIRVRKNTSRLLLYDDIICKWFDW